MSSYHAGDGSAWWLLRGSFLSNREKRECDDETALRHIKRRLFDYIWERMRAYGEDEPPFLQPDSKFVTRFMRATVVEEPDVHYASLDVGRDGFTVYVDEAQSEAMKRTSIAHELGHAYLYDFESVPIEPVAGEEIEPGSAAPTEQYFGWNEGFAWQVGRHLLVPAESLERRISRTPSIYQIEDMIERFFVTRAVAAKRLYWDTHDWSSGDNYWKDSVYLSYPRSKWDDGERPPKGNSEVHLGSEFKNFDVRARWPEIRPVVRRALADKRTILNSRDAGGPGSLEFRGERLVVEAKYAPRTGHVHVLVVPERSMDEREFVTLSQFA